MASFSRRIAVDRARSEEASVEGGRGKDRGEYLEKIRLEIESGAEHRDEAVQVAKLPNSSRKYRRLLYHQRRGEQMEHVSLLKAES